MIRDLYYLRIGKIHTNNLLYVVDMLRHSGLEALVPNATAKPDPLRIQTFGTFDNLDSAHRLFSANGCILMHTNKPVPLQPAGIATLQLHIMSIRFDRYHAYPDKTSATSFQVTLSKEYGDKRSFYLRNPDADMVDLI